MESGHGRFVIVSSGQAQAPTHKNAAYAAAKAAHEAWTLALADRFRGTGATANIVVVGSILTPEMREEEPGQGLLDVHPRRGDRRGDRLSLLRCSGVDERPAAHATRRRVTGSLPARGEREPTPGAAGAAGSSASEPSTNQR